MVEKYELFGHIVKPRTVWETKLKEFNQALVQINQNISVPDLHVC